MPTPLLKMSPAGLYCEAGDFYVDPWQGVRRAIITHAHSDHARWGSEHYLATQHCGPLLRSRLGADIALQTLRYGETLQVGSVQVSLHPAGHVLGSAQVRLESDGQVAVVTGDYKLAHDSTCEPFEPLRCDLMVTESTFGLPVFSWADSAFVGKQINEWWLANQAAGKASVLYGYALGKSQRILSMLDSDIGPIYIHGALNKPTQIYRQCGVPLAETKLVSEAPAKTDWSRAMILAVPSAHGMGWLRKFGAVSTAMASGWMAIRGTRRRRSVDRGFVISDHADWPGLLQAIGEAQPQQVWVTHGFADILARYLSETGIAAEPLASHFVGESIEPSESENESE